MPQLDKVHFFSQYFWLCVFYFGFYFLIVKHFLPRMARILQFRKNKLSHHEQDNQDKELNLVKESGNTVLENIFTQSHNNKRMEDWYGDKVSSINNNYLKQANHLYVKKVGDYSLSQNAAIAGMELARPVGPYIWFLARKLKQVKSQALPNNINFSFNTNTDAKPTIKKVSKKTMPNSTNSSLPSNNKKLKKTKNK